MLPTYYVPILKWKRAERTALSELKEAPKRSIVPLLQLVMPKPSTKDNELDLETQLVKLTDVFQQRLPKIPSEILKGWGSQRFFIDVALLFTTELKVAALQELLEGGYELGLSPVPVVSLEDHDEIKQAVSFLIKKYDCGVCLRLGCSDLARPLELSSKLDTFFRVYNLREDSVDLLVDVKEIGDDPSKYSTNLLLAQQIPHLDRWRMFIFASGAFPKDLSKCSFDEENHIPRFDWKSWVDHISETSLPLRKPCFSDYTIQYPIYDESSQFFHPTTSIKYTLGDSWLVLKGKKRKYELYLVNAKLLTENQEWFSGENFSYGDSIIAEKAKHFAEYQKNPALKGTGSTETWLSVGINHHLTYTANQIANLSENIRSA